jgi:hypothetical protein
VLSAGWSRPADPTHIRRNPASSRTDLKVKNMEIVVTARAAGRLVGRLPGHGIASRFRPAETSQRAKPA